MDLKTLNNICKNTMIDHLGIEFTEIGENHIIATMPVDNRTIQPMKRLHGGASMALAETIGSAGSLAILNSKDFMVLGVEISGSHVASTNESEVKATGTLVYQGKARHVWEIRIEDKNRKLLSICRLTNSILPVKNKEDNA
ncbi:MAG: hotdog fold thioesterase [Bacteroidia bacterium]|nr:hotdog fold thioesterase [Bacteroidia bacterium]